VTNNKISVIFEDENVLVVDKPASIPVHESGRYHYNSLVKILEIERGGEGECLRNCHRLDRLTSG